MTRDKTRHGMSLMKPYEGTMRLVAMQVTSQDAGCGLQLSDLSVTSM